MFRLALKQMSQRLKRTSLYTRMFTTSAGISGPLHPLRKHVGKACERDCAMIEKLVAPTCHTIAGRRRVQRLCFVIHSSRPQTLEQQATRLPHHLPARTT